MCVEAIKGRAWYGFQKRWPAKSSHQYRCFPKMG